MKLPEGADFSRIRFKQDILKPVRLNLRSIHTGEYGKAIAFTSEVERVVFMQLIYMNIMLIF